MILSYSTDCSLQTLQATKQCTRSGLVEERVRVRVERERGGEGGTGWEGDGRAGEG
jgi:hypothetical protein